MIHAERFGIEAHAKRIGWVGVQIVRLALAEDAGDLGDVTSLATIAADAQATATFLAKADGTLAGVAVANMVFAQLDPTIEVGCPRTPLLVLSIEERLSHESLTKLAKQCRITLLQLLGVSHRRHSALPAASFIFCVVFSSPALAEGWVSSTVRSEGVSQSG
jgi:hypothetical protein